MCESYPGLVTAYPDVGQLPGPRASKGALSLTPLHMQLPATCPTLPSHLPALIRKYIQVMQRGGTLGGSVLVQSYVAHKK